MTCYNDTDKEKFSLNSLKLILSVMVVFIHTRIFFGSGAFLDSLTSNGVFRLAVPIFFIINGFFLPVEMKKMKIWLKKSLFLYLGLSAVFAIFWVNIHSLDDFIITSIRYGFFGYLHLWYIQAMLISGVFVFFFKSNKFFPLCVCVFFLLGWSLQIYSNIEMASNVSQKINYLYYRNALTLGIPFMAIGYFLRNSEKFMRFMSSNLTLVISVFIFSLEVFVNYKIWGESQSDNVRYSVDVLLSSVLISPAIFCFVLKFARGLKIQKDLPSYIYFSHPFPMLMIKKMHPSISNLSLSFYTLLLAVCISYFFILFLSALRRRKAKVLPS